MERSGGGVLRLLVSAGDPEADAVTLPSDMRRWPPEAREFFEERAAIREWLGKMPRDEAERLAEEDVRRWWSAGLSREERKGRGARAESC